MVAKVDAHKIQNMYNDTAGGNADSMEAGLGL